MADVTIDPPDGSRLREADRGQMLVVAGLVMAVSLVALVVLLNATIYSENLATRGIEAADGEAMEIRATAVGGVGGLVDATNRRKPGSHAAANGTVLAGVSDLDDRMARSYAGRGGVAAVETNESRLTEGWYLSTDGNGTSLVNATNATAYTFAGGVDRTRRFTLDFEAASLAETTTSNATGEAFHVAFDGSALSESGEVYVYRNATTDRVVVANATGGNDPTVRCEIDPGTDGKVTVDLTGERLADTPCIGVWPSALFAPSDAYTIGFENADAAAGNASATVRTRPDRGTEPDADHGDVSHGVYDATIDLRYRTAELRFETTVRVAPGEPRA